MSRFTIPTAISDPTLEVAEGLDGRTLVLSMRRVADLVGYCAMYEFEDVLVAMLGADLACVVGPQPRSLLSGAGKLAGLVRSGLGAAAPGGAAVPSTPLRERYDSLFAIFNNPYELFALNAVKQWRKRFRFAACYICEAWESQLPAFLGEALKDFDHVFVGVRGSVEVLTKLCGRPCTYLPMGVDTIAFCPAPNPPPRAIDVCGVGRRSPVTHAALLDWARKTNSFYYYDTIQSAPARGTSRSITFRVMSVQEHRFLFSTLLKRSRYFIANRAWADRPALTGGGDEIAARFYEGAAAGCVILGEPPDTDDFREQFGWRDSVIRVPFHSQHIAEVIAELDAAPDRLSSMRRESAVNSLMRHDWLYRIQAILKVAGVAATPALVAREGRLSELAKSIVP